MSDLTEKAKMILDLDDAIVWPAVYGDETAISKLARAYLVLRDALRWYGDEDNYQWQDDKTMKGWGLVPILHEDKGKRARDALRES